MDIESLNTGVKYSESDGLYDLFEPTFIYNPNIQLFEYVVTIDDEMRIDLIFKHIYGIDITFLDRYLKDIDIILFINNIENPLNIMKDDILLYPDIEQLGMFRYSRQSETTNNTITSQLGVHNIVDKTTKIDKNRKDFKENDYSLPPVVLQSPKDPVRILDGKFSIGGL